MLFQVYCVFLNLMIGCILTAWDCEGTVVFSQSFLFMPIFAP
nr:MAG TPA: hypothetical protein [Caudoviricetes sp.]